MNSLTETAESLLSGSERIVNNTDTIFVRVADRCDGCRPASVWVEGQGGRERDATTMLIVGDDEQEECRATS